MRPRVLCAALALGLAGCATTYQLSLMPRDSGRVYSGTARDAGGGEGPIAITIDGREYAGTWVQSVPERSNAYVSGGIGWGRWHGAGIGTVVTYDNPRGGEAKALLRTASGQGLRCDLRLGGGYGDGLCRDDAGREYDVQIRPAPRA